MVVCEFVTTFFGCINDNMLVGRKMNLRIKVNTLVSIILMLGMVVFMQSVSAKNIYYSL